MASADLAPGSVYVKAGPDELHVTVWGRQDLPAVVLWHGLARNGRDFDELASALCGEYLVLCPDTLGRGLSSWARDAATGYSHAAFGDHALAILDHFGIGQLRWVGTSMGGLLGVTLAAGRLKGRITHLAVNDIGPSIPEAAAQRIAEYVGNPPVFASLTELEAWLRTSYAPFGRNTDIFWRRMTDHSFRRTDDGRVTVHYDPQIATQFTLHRADLDCWAAWDRLDLPTLLIRGETSDVLPADLAAEMLRRGPRPRFVEFGGFGHAPTLTTEREISVLRDFLATRGGSH